ncbi:MAG: MFS transporter [Victivallaceae bacterium]|nr:MFS transporter [Victivallaceae bacterium]
MLKFFTRSIPVVVNFIQHGFGLFFAALIATMGGDGWQVSLPGVAAGIVYPVSTFLVGKLITQKRLTALIAASGILISTAATGIFFLNSFWWLVAWSIVVNVAVTLHAVPIQLLIRRVQGDRPGGNGLIKTVSIYLVGVSIGQGLGVLFCGHISRATFCAAGCGLGLLMVAVMIWVARGYPPSAELPAATAEKAPETSTGKIPGPVIAGWVLVGLISLGLSMMTASVTYRGNILGFSEAVRADVLSVRSFVEGIVVFLLIFSRKWVDFRQVPAGLATVFAVSFAFFAFGTTASFFYAASILFGIALGMGLFYVSYHALQSSGSNGKYCVVSEIIIGVTQFLGPVCGAVATPQTSGLPFAIAAAVAVAVTLFFIFFLRGQDKVFTA